MKIVRKKLTADEFSPANKRYLLDEDIVQTSPDGGVTWYDDPASDPRHNPLNLLPPRTGDNVQCDAAESMMQHFRAQVDAFLTGGNILTVVNLIVGLLLFLPGVNVLVALLFAIADALFAIGVVAIDAAMTEPVYDQIKCILFCHADEDGRLSAEAVEAVYSDVDAQIGGVAATVFHEITRSWGEVGFSNAGASGEYEGDCDECACGWTYCWLGGDGLGDWITPTTIPGDARSAGLYDSGTDTIGSTAINIFGDEWANFELNETLEISGINIDFDYVNEPDSGGVNFWANEEIAAIHEPLESGSGSTSWAWSSGFSFVDKLQLRFAALGHVTITRIKIDGRGTPPASGVECV